MNERSRGRLDRQLSIAADATRPPRERKRASRHAASLAEQLGLLERPDRCEWCRGLRKRGRGLTRHHPDHSKPLEILYLCGPCHDLADDPRTDPIPLAIQATA